MEVRNQINQQIISAAVNMLNPYVPELTAVNLIEALKNHNTEEKAAPQLEKPLSRKEVAELLGVSLVTVSRYLKSGKLRKIKISGKCVRICPESLRDLLGQEGEENESDKE